MPKSCSVALGAQEHETRRSLQNAQLAPNLRAVDRSAAGEEILRRVRVARNDPVQLVLSRTEMLSDNLAKHLPIIACTPEITAVDPEHRAGRAGDPRNRIGRAAIKHARTCWRR